MKATAAQITYDDGTTQRLIAEGIAPPASGQSPYGGTPAQIPGVVQAENFDVGGPGVAYHTIDGINVGGKYRPLEGVSITDAADLGGGYLVGWTADGQWMEYTVDVRKSGDYRLEARVASMGAAPGRLDIIAESNRAPVSIAVPNTGGWQKWLSVAEKISLNAGPQILRVEIPKGGFNLNNFALSEWVEPPPPTPGTTGAWPSETTTGPTNAALLKPSKTIVVTQNGAVVRDVLVSGTIDIKANNVTIDNFSMTPDAARFWAIQPFPGTTGTVIKNGLISGVGYNNGIAGANYTADNVCIKDMSADAFGIGNGTTIQNCYVTRIARAAGAHGDGGQSQGADGVILRHNFFDLDTKANSAIMMNGGFVTRNWLIENNQFDGGSWMFYSYADPTILYRGNRIGRKAGYGILYPQPGNVGYGKDAVLAKSWDKSNVWMDNGQPVYP